MPQNRPRPLNLNAAPRTKGPSSPKGKNTKRPRSPKSGGNSNFLTWTAIILGVLLVSLTITLLWIRSSPRKESSYSSTHPETPAPAAIPRTTPPPSAVAEDNPPVPAPLPAPAQPPVHVKTLKEKADEETQHLVEQTSPTKSGPATIASASGAIPPKPPVAPPATTAPALPPVAQPLIASQAKGIPARALPLDPNKLTPERIAAYQVALERIHFSCGFVDGDQGMRTQRMLRAYQTSRGLPVTGFLDDATRASIGEPGEPFLSYTVTADDIASIMPKPPTWKAKAAATRLGYNDIWELLGEKFHCARSYLKQLNPTVKAPVAGTEIIGPKVYPAAPIPHAASLRISLTDTSIEALDASGKIIAFFPCSIAKDKAKRPSGELTVKVVDPHPDYTFDPALFADAATAEGITHKMILPPGPRNPVGTDWVGLSLPGYGIHGTPEPENISRTQSHGCFRLANWNADKVLKMVKVGTPIDVEQ